MERFALLRAASLIALISCCSQFAFADELLATRAPGTLTVSDGGFLIDDANWVGARFVLAEKTKIQTLGIELAAITDGSFFAAVIRMPNFDAGDTASHIPSFAASAASLEANTLAHGVKSLPASDYSDRYKTALFDIADIVLGSGSYGVIFGSGAFQTHGIGQVAATLEEDGAEAYFTAVDMSFSGHGVQWLGFSDSPDIYGARMVVFGEPALTIPEPEAASLLLAGLVLLGVRSRVLART